MGTEASLISFVAMSKRRKEILEKLSEIKLSQPEIRKITGMYKSHTSRTLLELADKNLIKCINPESRAFKFYKITPLGARILKEVRKIIS